METPVCRTAGKQVKRNRDVHVVALEELAPDLRGRVQLAVARAGLSEDTEFNVVKIDESGEQISLLDYKRFFDNPFPALKRSCVVDLASGRIKHLHYEQSRNPPILHRKELLLPSRQRGMKSKAISSSLLMVLQERKNVTQKI